MAGAGHEHEAVARQRCHVARRWARLRRRVEVFSVRSCVSTVCRAVRRGRRRAGPSGVAYEPLVTEEERRLLDEFEARSIQHPAWAGMPFYD